MPWQFRPPDNDSVVVSETALYVGPCFSSCWFYVLNIFFRETDDFHPNKWILLCQQVCLPTYLGANITNLLSKHRKKSNCDLKMCYRHILETCKQGNGQDADRCNQEHKSLMKDCDFREAIALRHKSIYSKYSCSRIVIINNRRTTSSAVWSKSRRHPSTCQIPQLRP